MTKNETVNEVNELYYKLEGWFPKWFKSLEDRHKKELIRKRIWKRNWQIKMKRRKEIEFNK